MLSKETPRSFSSGDTVSRSCIGEIGARSMGLGTSRAGDTERSNEMAVLPKSHFKPLLLSAAKIAFKRAALGKTQRAVIADIFGLPPDVAGDLCWTLGFHPDKIARD